MTEFDKFVEVGKNLATRAMNTAGELVDKGKAQIDRAALENQLAKSQRQLGALVYSLKKSGETNDQLLEHYIDVIADVEARLNAQEAVVAEKYCVSICPSCGAEVAEDAGFCAHCGTKLD